MSRLRTLMKPKDRNAYRILMTARHYHGKNYLFLTLTFGDTELYPARKLARLLTHLRRKRDIEYFCVRTSEGHGVFHLCLISKFIHHTEIRERWRTLTEAWSINIQFESNLHGLLLEMTGQYGVVRYSRSQGLIPQGTTQALDRLKVNLPYVQRKTAYSMFGRRLKTNGGNVDKAYSDTLTCLERGSVGSYSVLWYKGSNSVRNTEIKEEVKPPKKKEVKYGFGNY